MSMRIIQRNEWGAQYDDGFHDRDLPATEVWLHHSVTVAPDLVAPFDDDYAAIRTLEWIGEQRFGAGISYTWPITPAGLIFQGHSPGRSGAHTLNRNDIASAICWVGNYDIAEPTEELIRSTAWLLVHANRQGWIRRARLDGGHQQAPGQDPTGCPGSHALAAIGRVNQLAADYEAGRINLDEPAHPRTIGGEDMLIKKLTGKTGVGTVALVSGGIVSAVDPKWAEETNAKAGGGLLIGVSEPVWDDLVRKSTALESTPKLLAELLDELRARPAGQ